MNKPYRVAFAGACLTEKLLNHITLPLQTLIILTVAVMANTRDFSGTQPRDSLGYRTVPLKEGDHCLVCGTGLRENGIVILYKGRRVPLLNQRMLEIFLSDPEGYFPKLQPRGALFQESAVASRPMKLGWFFAGLWVAAALFSGALSASLALRKGLSPRRGFFTGLIGNLFGLVYMAARPVKQKVDLPPYFARIPSTAEPVICPACRAYNHPSASQCTSCGIALTPKAEGEVGRAGTS